MTTFYLGLPGEDRPAIWRALKGTRLGGFVSYITLEANLELARSMPYWALDSGAFSAFTQGTTIDLHKFADDVKALLASPAPPREVYSLDVIGDWRASLRNYAALERLGVRAIPTWHLGDPESMLLDLARGYPKIAIGGIAKLAGPKRVRFLQQVFERIWPARVHGFGVMSEAAVMAVPFHSVDAISWSSAFRWGFWKHYGQKEGYIYLYGIPGDKVDLGVECRAYERLASKVAGKWADELARLETAR